MIDERGGVEPGIPAILGGLLAVRFELHRLLVGHIVPKDKLIELIESIDYLSQSAKETVVNTAAIEWIPVSDQFPTTKLRVLAAYNDGRTTTTIRALHIPPKTVIDYNDFDESEYDEETDQYYFPAGWYEAVESGEYAFVGPLDGTVTHWAQLPALPSKEVQP